MAALRGTLLSLVLLFSPADDGFDQDPRSPRAETFRRAAAGVKSMERADRKRLLDRLWDWSTIEASDRLQAIDPDYSPAQVWPKPEELADLKVVALAYLDAPDADWSAAIKDYSEKYFLPASHLSRASALYLFFRVVFDLPTDLPRHRAKVFGGWVHPSGPVVGQPKPIYFNLSWPVEIREDSQTLLIHAWEGYFGGAYDAVREYNYFLRNFPRRDRDALAQLEFVYSGRSTIKEAMMKGSAGD